MQLLLQEKEYIGKYSGKPEELRRLAAIDKTYSAAVINVEIPDKTIASQYKK